MEQVVFRISLIQYAPCWENVQQNLLRLNGMLQPLAGHTDMIVLGEMFSTGFSMNTAQTCSSENSVAALQWMKQQAETTGAMIAGSIAVAENGLYYNRFYMVRPDGIEYYDKHHLFSMSDEPRYFTAGTERKQFEWRGCKIRPVVCYDLRFPGWCRNSRTNPYDLLICTASWPTVRSDVWLSLLKARAIENQSYVAGVNRTGTDGNGLHHQGDTIVYGPKGETMGRIPENAETTLTLELPLTALHDFRRKFPVLEDMDSF